MSKFIFTGLLFFLVAIGNAQIPQNGLIAHYSFSGNADDISGNGHHGLLNGSPTLVDDRFGNANSAYLFDGSVDYIEIPHDIDFDRDSSMSISCWFYVADSVVSTASNWNRIVTRHTTDGIGVENYAFWYGDDKAIHCYLGPNANAGYHVSSSVVLTDQWNHCVLTIDADSVKMYLNNQQIYSAPSIMLFPVYTIHPTIIGGGGSSSPMPAYIWEGMLDDFLFYDRALSSLEINEIYDYVETSTELTLDNEALVKLINGRTIAFHKTNSNSVQVQIINFYGQCVQFAAPNSSGLVLISDDLASGIYIVKIINEHGRASTRKIYLN